MRIAALSFAGLLLGTLPSVEAGPPPVSAPPNNRAKPTPAPSPAGKPNDPDDETGGTGTKKAVKVSGTVVDRNDAPVVRAQVILGPKSVWTGQDGTFELDGPAVGTITVKQGQKSQDFAFSVTKKGLQPAQLVFTKE
jgi:hypothetical protein